MMKHFFAALFALVATASFAQTPDSSSQPAEAWTKLYRATATKLNDLVDTKLDVRFDYARQWMYGKEWVTLHPHFYPTDTLTLDAKSMAINKVALMKGGREIPLKYTYDSSQLFIKLDKVYTRTENYTLYT